MSWKSGGALFELFVGVIDAYVPTAEERLKVYKRIAEEFWSADCDTLEYGLEGAMHDELTLRRAFVEIGYWREDYGDTICKTHYRVTYEDAPCTDCDHSL